jgi:hypothetical protein
MLAERWAVSVCLTDLPLRVGATALTLAFGISALYVALFLRTSVSGYLLIAPVVLEAEIHHQAVAREYLPLAWLVSSLATIGGALGAAVESEAAVREAAYGFRGDHRENP